MGLLLHAEVAMEVCMCPTRSGIFANIAKILENSRKSFYIDKIKCEELC